MIFDLAVGVGADCEVVSQGRGSLVRFALFILLPGLVIHVLVAQAFDLRRLIRHLFHLARLAEARNVVVVLAIGVHVVVFRAVGRFSRARWNLYDSGQVLRGTSHAAWLSQVY